MQEEDPLDLRPNHEALPIAVPLNQGRGVDEAAGQVNLQVNPPNIAAGQVLLQQNLGPHMVPAVAPVFMGVVPVMVLPEPFPRPLRGNRAVIQPRHPHSGPEYHLLRSVLDGRLSRTDRLYRHCSHLEVCFYESPDQMDWKCVRCWWQSGHDYTWNFKKYHSIWRITELRTPGCPGTGMEPCPMNPHVLRPLSTYSDCVLIYACNRDRIDNGMVFETCTCPDDF